MEEGMDEAERRRQLAQRLYEMRKTQPGGGTKPKAATPPTAPMSELSKQEVRPVPTRTPVAPQPARPTVTKAERRQERKPKAEILPSLTTNWPKREAQPDKPLTRSNPERVLANSGMRMVYEAAQAAGREIEFVIDSSRLCAQSRFLIDRELVEVRHATRSEERGRLAARVQFSRSRVVLGDLHHLVLVDIEERDVLRAYRFTSEYLKWRLFSTWRERAELLIPIDGDSIFDLYRLDWPFKRPRPAD